MQVYVEELQKPWRPCGEEADGSLMATRRLEDPGLGLGLSMEQVKVELGGLEPPAPCLQSDVYVCPRGADLAIRLSVSSREIPQRTPVNGTLMARLAVCFRV